MHSNASCTDTPGHVCVYEYVDIQMCLTNMCIYLYMHKEINVYDYVYTHIYQCLQMCLYVFAYMSVFMSESISVSYIW